MPPSVVGGHPRVTGLQFRPETNPPKMECLFWSLVLLLVYSTSGSVFCLEEVKIGGNETVISSNTSSSSGRSPRQWPFWSVGRIANSPCQSSNGLTGTCQIRGECDANGGIAYGTCSTLTTQSVCCVCKFEAQSLRCMVLEIFVCF